MKCYTFSIASNFWRFSTSSLIRSPTPPTTWRKGHFTAGWTVGTTLSMSGGAHDVRLGLAGVAGATAGTGLSMFGGTVGVGVGFAVASGTTTVQDGGWALAGDGLGFMTSNRVWTRTPASICIFLPTVRRPGARASTVYAPGGISAKRVSPSDPEGALATSYPSFGITRTVAAPTKGESSGIRRITFRTVACVCADELACNSSLELCGAAAAPAGIDSRSRRVVGRRAGARMMGTSCRALRGSGYFEWANRVAPKR